MVTNTVSGTEHAVTPPEGVMGRRPTNHMAEWQWPRREPRQGRAHHASGRADLRLKTVSSHAVRGTYRVFESCDPISVGEGERKLPRLEASDHENQF
jgi:hypothetical protein